MLPGTDMARWMRRLLPMLAILTGAVVSAVGCSFQQQPYVAPQVTQVPAEPLPFKGKLASGDPNELPPAVALSLSPNSPITFMYREQLTHDDHRKSLFLTALAPTTYAGAALGSFGVTAFASLAIVEGPKVIGNYTAKVHLSESYNLYSTPTHEQLDHAAREAVRQKIDEQLYRDRARLAQEASTNSVHGTPGGLSE